MNLSKYFMCCGKIPTFQLMLYLDHIIRRLAPLFAEEHVDVKKLFSFKFFFLPLLKVGQMDVLTDRRT